MFWKRHARGTAQPAGLTTEHVRWAYRLLLDREPENEDVLRSTARAIRTTPELRRAMMSSDEYQAHAVADAFAGTSIRVVSILDDGLRVCLDLADAVSGAGVVLGMGEVEERRWIRDTLRTGDVALDLGANVGLLTVTMAAAVGSTGRVVAFEPQPAAAELLQISVRENGFDDRVRIETVALGAQSGTVHLLDAPNGNLSASHLVANTEARPTVEARMVTLDGQDLPRPVRLIKADIEGAEPLAFTGAERLLGEDRPLILCELNPVRLTEVAGVSPREFIGQMDGRRYGCTALDGTPITEVTGTIPVSAVFRPR
ncbi:MAG: FkbM family methyltransferase [bacterium]|nr:FkbM family methyltransferase [bacterium]